VVTSARESGFGKKRNGPLASVTLTSPQFTIVIEEENELFIVMEYVEGRTLRRRLADPISVLEFLTIATECALALARHTMQVSCIVTSSRKISC